MFIKRSAILLLMLFNSLFVVQASPIKRISNYDQLVISTRNLIAKVIGTQQAFVARGKTTLNKLGRATAVGSLNVLVVACLTSFALDGCRVSDQQRIIGAISNYSQGKVHDNRFSQLSEDHNVTYLVTEDGQLEIVDVAEETSTIDRVAVQPVTGYRTLLDLLEPEFSSTWDNRLVEDGAVLARLLWHRPQKVAWDQLGEPLVAGQLATIETVNFSVGELPNEFRTVIDGTSYSITIVSETIEGAKDQDRYSTTDVTTMDGRTLAVFGREASDREYLVLIDRISTIDGQSPIKPIYVIARPIE